MGGVDTEDWFLYPEQPAVLIGTQDMLLSRVLNRGYAASRFHWPIDFGLLNNDCLWVFDEPQLMGSGVSTSAQLAGLREKLTTFGPCPSVWMSATLEPGWLDTIDFRGRFPGNPLELTKEDYDPARPLHKRMTAKKTLAALGRSFGKDADPKEVDAVAKAVVELHQAGTQTLVVLNTVRRAKAVFAALDSLLKKAKKDVPKLLLVHSRYRPYEREGTRERSGLNAKLQQTGDAAKDRIIVATQVVEAGVDISSRTLITELAPWASIVQRIGRCNRTGDDGPGRVFWIDLDTEKQSAPYEQDELEKCRARLRELDGQDVSPRALSTFHLDPTFPHKHVVRQRDLIDLFDTAPDLSGNDIDVARFVRGDDPDTDVQVYWRDEAPEQNPDAETRRKQSPRREELCNVPIGDFKKFLEADKTAYRWDFLDKEWRKLGKRDAPSIIPGQVFWIPADEGGYDPLRGWDWNTGSRVPTVPLPESVPDDEQSQREDTAYDSDDWSHFGWRSIAGHTNEVMTELERMLGQDAQLPLTQSKRASLRMTVRWHDWGKAHPVFQASIKSESRPTDWAGREDIGKAPDGFWGRCKRQIDERTVTVSRFRHELASALGVLTLLRAEQGPPDWQELTRDEQDLALYLIASHHGKVRLSVRVMPGEKPIPTDTEKTRFAAGVWDGDELPVTDLGDGTVTAAVKLDLAPMLLGDGSWTARMLAVRNRFHPFRLAYLEALVRAADCRASANADRTKEDSHA
jgi:CRISPR-associated endonuclease/helicase Cas3